MITSFTGQYAFLSNFYPCRIEMYGLEFPTAEHVYQWHKAIYPLDAELIRVQLTPGRARKIAHSIPIRPDWDAMCISIMHVVLLHKFEQHPDMLQLLRNTRPHTLIEGNKWGDQFWGQVSQEGRWVGRNELGRLLMGIRAVKIYTQGELYKPDPTGEEAVTNFDDSQ